MRVLLQTTCCSGRSGLRVSRGYLIELGARNRPTSGWTKIRRGKSVGPTVDGAGAGKAAMGVLLQH